MQMSFRNPKVCMTYTVLRIKSIKQSDTPNALETKIRYTPQWAPPPRVSPSQPLEQKLLETLGRIVSHSKWVFLPEMMPVGKTPVALPLLAE